MKADDGVRLTARRQPPQKTAAPAEEDDLLNIKKWRKRLPYKICQRSSANFVLMSFNYEQKKKKKKKEKVRYANQSVVMKDRQTT